MSWEPTTPAEVAYAERTRRYIEEADVFVRAEMIRVEHTYPKPRTCKGCDCLLDQSTPGCDNCRARHAMRELKVKRQSQDRLAA